MATVIRIASEANVLGEWAGTLPLDIDASLKAYGETVVRLVSRHYPDAAVSFHLSDCNEVSIFGVSDDALAEEINECVRSAENAVYERGSFWRVA
jgi:hypothetical protein